MFTDLNPLIDTLHLHIHIHIKHRQFVILIYTAAIEYVMTLCIENASVHEICKLGDDFITLETSKIYNKKQKVVLKGIAFPCALSLNNTICHFSPIASDPEILLKFDDIVKIQIGAHIDGFSAQVAHTIVVGASVDAPVTGRKADTIMAAHYCVEAAMRTLVPGNTNWQVTEIIQKVNKLYTCSINSLSFF